MQVFWVWYVINVENTFTIVQEIFVTKYVWYIFFAYGKIRVLALQIDSASNQPMITCNKEWKVYPDATSDLDEFEDGSFENHWYFNPNPNHKHDPNPNLIIY